VLSVVCNEGLAAVFFGADFTMQTDVARRLFTVDDYYRMAEAGIIGEDERVELIEGEIVRMSPIGDRHFQAVNRATMIFARGIGDRAVVSIQNPASMDRYNEPQPDVVLIRPREGFYGAGKPAPEDVLLLIEVADTTLPKDRNAKLPVYARNGIREVWIVDLQHDLILVFRDPKDGAFVTTETFKRGQAVCCGAFPEFTIEAGELLGV
jgi:Uma2 family endonuclease